THAPAPDLHDDAHARVLAHLEQRGEASPYLGIHQRLDRDTSGVLLFTHRREANRAVASQFEGREVKKTYVAAGRGRLGPGRGVLRHRIAAGRDGAVRALPPDAREGQEAITRWRTLVRSGDRALLELTPETGRTHQIRAQLAAAGAPIAGDPLYGGAPAPRLHLHASALALRHPSTGKPITFRSPAPPSFARWVEGAAAGLPAEP